MLIIVTSIKSFNFTKIKFISIIKNYSKIQINIYSTTNNKIFKKIILILINPEK